MFDNLLLIVDVFLRSLLWIIFPARRGQEILRLRKELQVLRRQVKRPQFSSWDRLFFTSLYKLNSRIIDDIVIVKPSTVVAWHKKLVAKKWSFKNKPGRPQTKEEIRTLIVEMKMNNPRWGSRRIKGELRKLGVSISKTTILSILKDSGFSPTRRHHDESWLRFLKSHSKRFFSCDFLTVETAFLKRLYVFTIMDVSSREILVSAVTANPTAAWLENIVRGCFVDISDLPQVMVSDRDGIYGEWFGEYLKNCYDMKLYRTPPQCPNCNAHIERWHRSLREELLDNRIVFGQRDLRKLLKDYIPYYNETRPHLSLSFNSPSRVHGENTVFDLAKIRRERQVDGLFVSYSLAG